MNLRNNTDILNFVVAAKTFCDLVVTPSDDAGKWVEQVLSTLSGLYAFAHHLPELSIEDTPEVDEEICDVSDEEWKHVSNNVASLLRDQRYYREYFDPSEPIDAEVKPVIGDIADDLSDIYRDIKPGLRAWDTEDDALIPDIVFNWVHPNFRSHWGDHALSAMRVLHPLCFIRGIQKSHMK